MKEFKAQIFHLHESLSLIFYLEFFIILFIMIIYFQIFNNYNMSLKFNFLFTNKAEIISFSYLNLFKKEPKKSTRIRYNKINEV